MSETYFSNYSYLWSFGLFLLFYDHQDTESESLEMKMGVSGENNTQERHQRLYGTTASIHKNMSENILVVIHIYGARVIFLRYRITKTLNLIHKE